MLLWVVVGASLLLSLLLPFLLKPILSKLGVLDIPNERSSHDSVVIRGVGITVAVGIVVGLALSVLTGLVPVDRSIVLIVLAVRWLGGLPHESRRPPERSSARAILEERFARGEIDKEEFEERQRLLSG